MKKKIIFAALILVLAAGIGIAQYSASNYREQGGLRWVIGGSLDVISGGDLDVESGGALKIAGTQITSSAAELNALDGISGTNALELNQLDGLTAMSSIELNLLSGLTATGSLELNQLDGLTGMSSIELNLLSGLTAVSSLELNQLDGLTALSGVELNQLDGTTGMSWSSGNLTLGGGYLSVSTSYVGMRGFYLENPHTILLAGATAASVTQTTGTGMTIQLGTNNGRNGALEAVQFILDGTANDALTVDFGSTVDATNYNFVGFWITCSGAIDAAQFDIRFQDNAASIIDGTTLTSLAAIEATDWHYHEIYIGGATDKSDLHKMELISTDTGTETCTLTMFKAYALSNGYGPCNGEVIRYPVATGTIDKGDFVAMEFELTQTTSWGVGEAGDSDIATLGIACDNNATGETSYALVQVSGIFAAKAAGAIVDNALTNPKSATTIDDDGAAQDQPFYALEIANDANEITFHRFIK